MAHAIRSAGTKDKEAVLSFTRDTFLWGDYIHHSWDDWIDDPQGRLLVAVDSGDAPVAVGFAQLLSSTEAWLQGLRVREDARRQGLAAALTDDLARWAADRGALVARLLIEAWNEPSAALAESCDFRPVAAWALAARAVGEASPVPAGNGGRRVSAAEKLGQAPSSEAEPAFVAWSGGELAGASRGLFATDWTWRRLTIEDLAAAGKNQAFWQARTGWALGTTAGDRFRVDWAQTNPPEAPAFAKAVVDLALDHGVDGLEVILPETSWLVQAFRTAGCSIDEFRLFARSL